MFKKKKKEQWQENLNKNKYLNFFQQNEENLKKKMAECKRKSR